MADNNTFVLFEEIKNKLETIYRELKELKEKENSSVSLPVQSTPAQSAEQKDQELLNLYEQRTKDVINKYIGVQVRIKDEEAKSMDKLVASVLTMLHECRRIKSIQYRRNIFTGTALISNRQESLLLWWLCLSSVLFLWSETTSCGNVNSNMKMML